MSDPSHSDQSHEDHGGLGKYFAVFLALCVLTGASFFTYSSYWPFHDTPQIGWAFMMVVSCTKAMLVILFFMHVFWEANWKYVLTIPASCMSLFLVLMLVPDVGLRMNKVSRERALHMAIEVEAAEDPDDAGGTEQGETNESHGE